MKRKVINSRVGHDGVLHLELPLGVEVADKDVRITIETAKVKKMSQAEWEAMVDRTAGSITDPDFIRHPQGEYEIRDSLS